MDAKESTGCTSLHVALGGSDQHVGSFYKDAAKVLVTASAASNA
jgi:hypothetical protein